MEEGPKKLGVIVAEEREIGGIGRRREEGYRRGRRQTFRLRRGGNGGWGRGVGGGWGRGVGGCRRSVGRRGVGVVHEGVGGV